MKRKMTVQSVCLMLILALLLNLTACVNPTPPSTAPSQPTQPSASVPTTAPSEPTDPPTEPTTVPTDPPTEPPTEPTEPLVEPTFGENVPVYELKHQLAKQGLLSHREQVFLLFHAFSYDLYAVFAVFFVRIRFRPAEHHTAAARFRHRRSFVNERDFNAAV